jgi:DNA polymerase-1
VFGSCFFLGFFSLARGPLMPTLLLVDGSSYLYRAFHAMPDLRTTRSEPTGALHGVLNMLRRLESDYQARDVAYKACVFDAKGKTFRDDWYPQYKANRPPMPADMVCQIEPLHAAIAALGWPLLIVDGVEADDVIGTLAQQAAAQGVSVVVSTGDKDLAQLVGPQVSAGQHHEQRSARRSRRARGSSAFPPSASLTTWRWSAIRSTTCPASTKSVPRRRSSGSASMVRSPASLPPPPRSVASSARTCAVRSTSCRWRSAWSPFAATLSCRWQWLTSRRARSTANASPRSLHTTKCVPGCATFKRLRRAARRRPQQSSALAGSTPLPPLAQPEQASLLSDDAHRANYETILDQAAFERWLAKIDASPLTALDTETTSLDPFAARIVGLSLAVAEGEAAYLPLAHCYPGGPDQLPCAATLARLKPWLESAKHAKIGQNLKYDQHVLANHGIALAGVAHDTLLQSYVLESGKDGARGHDLGRLATRHLGLATIPYEALCGKGAKQISFAQVAIEQAAEYAAEDADLCLRLHARLYPQITADAGLLRVYETIEMPVREILLRMERTGVLIDAQLLGEQSSEIGKRLLELEAQAHAAAGQPFNVNSPKQLAEILFGTLGLPVKKKTPSGSPSTDEEVLSELALDYPLPKILLESRQLAKLKSTYSDKLPKMVNAQSGRVHTSYAQAVAVTGRLASSDPNLQNIPVRTPEGRRIRAAFIAPAGCSIVSADYSQIELRIMAHLSEDPRLLEAFAQGEDVHRATAAEIFGVSAGDVGPDQRRVAKVINFGLIYGMSAFGLARQLDLERSAAQAYIERYFARYPGVAGYMARTREMARTQGYVDTVFGRRLWLPEIRSSQAARRQGAERAAINAPMQGSAADLIKSAMIVVQGWLDAEGLQTRLLMQVHDELVLEVPDGELARVRAALPGLMTDWATLRVPLVVDVGVGANWDQAH